VLPPAYRLISEPSALSRAGLFVAEGRMVVQRLLENGRFRVHSIAVTPTAHRALAGMLAARPDMSVHVCDGAMLRETTGYDFHRGCLALASRDEGAMRAEELVRARRLLALEGVNNPDNVGGLFRAAFAFGFDAVLLDRAAGDPLYRKAIRTSMAATLRVPFMRAEHWLDTLRALRAHGHRIVALTPRADATPLDACPGDPERPVVLLVGSEGYGLSSESIAAADVTLRIPIDARADSLNVVVAAAIAMQRFGLDGHHVDAG